MMIRLTIFAVLLCLSSAQYLQFTPGNARLFEKEINQTLNDLQAQLAADDPKVLPKFDIEFSSELASMKLNAENIIIAGYSNFVASEIKLDVFPPSLRIVIKFQKFQVAVGSYKLDAKALFIPVYGSGSMNLIPEDVEIGISAKVGFRGNRISISEATPVFSLTKSQLSVSGVLNNPALSDIVSSSTTECFPEAVRNYKKRLSTILGPIFAEILNQLLSNLGGRSQIMPEPGTVKVFPFQEGDIKGRIRIHF